MDGIQPEKGNETVYVVRDALTGRVLAAENVTSKAPTVMKALLSSVVALEVKVKVLGTITDARGAANCWQSRRCGRRCRTRCASSTRCETRRKRPKIADKQVKTAMRKRLQPKVREVRKQIKKHLVTASPKEAKQLVVLDDYATGIVTAPPYRWAPALQVRDGGSQRDVGGDRS